TNGSREFKKKLEQNDMEGMVAMARDQEREGAHVLDVCTAYVGRDEVADMRAVVRRFNLSVQIPLVIDSTEWPVMEESLKNVSGKPILNSINLEDGEERIKRVVPLAKRYGAALIALTIDERGQATTADWKFEVARRIYDICTERYGVDPRELIFDCLTFPITTGQEETRHAAVATIEAIRRVKAELPGALTTLGVSNISFGVKPVIRQVINSVFLHKAIEAGLDTAIVNASKILPLNEIDPKGLQITERLVLNDFTRGDPLQELLAFYDKTVQKGGTAKRQKAESVEERLKVAIVQADRSTLIDDLELARQAYAPLDIINTVLLEGMKVVGELFGSGKMQLPFVLQSAEVMKAAVAHLEPYMERVQGSEKGRVVLATVKGDVHDIGKNLVDIILTNNGYKTFNLGIKQPIDAILAAARRHDAHAIGVSGLLVKSTAVMKEDMAVLREEGVTLPVICGGAALTRKFVEQDLRRTYRGPVYYGADAFTGLRIMDELCGHAPPTKETVLPPLPEEAAEPAVAGANGHAEGKPAIAAVVRSAVPPAPEIPRPPGYGTWVTTDIDVAEVFEFLNERAVIGTQWQFRKGGVAPAEYERQMQEVALPLLERMKAMTIAEDLLRPAVVHGFFPCQSQGNDLILYHDDERTERLRFHFPRQRGREHLCLADYFAAVGSGRMDVVALDVVTVGRRASERARQLYESNQYADYLYLHGISVEAAEALAEYWHQKIRQILGIAGGDAEDKRKLFK
ncbi:MAG TPA: dihydropteroate synthase, partial [Isosphaeraceae bacterium]